ncbi:MAG: hypothetical protein UGF86_00055, partial [Bifidobacterium longum]|nr:hypothetical protein [Bifidobacterium longum]
FQSTHPSGVRLGNRRKDYLPAGYFNPRTPVGCDGIDNGQTYANAISIHAPQWGATAVTMADNAHYVNFNPRTPVGCDRENGHSIP